MVNVCRNEYLVHEFSLWGWRTQFRFQKTLFYRGKLGIDTDEAIFNPEFDFDSKVKLTEGNFELNGNQI
jgi:hypothetical protein